MVDPSQEELLARIAELERKNEALEGQIEATVSGSGAIAQQGGTAAGKGGVAVGGDIHGNVYIGDPTDDPDEALAIYRRVYVFSCRPLPMRGIDVGASDPQGGQKQLDLDHVYVSLDTTARVELSPDGKRREDVVVMAERAETRAVTALEATVQNRRLVLLGDPGSGKSTFLNHLGLCLALHMRSPDEGWLDRLPEWPAKQADLTPINVTLRDFARSLTEPSKQAAPNQLWSFMVGQLEAQNLEFVEKPLRRLLEQGKAILLLDGLDEIPTQAQRADVRDAVAAFARRYGKSRMVVTCRTLSYQKEEWQLTGWPDFQLAELDEAKIDGFIAAWYAELVDLGAMKVDEGTRLTERLRTAVRRPDLRRLAPNPLLLTVMALVHTHRGRLPDARALLYEETVNILLLHWEQIKTGGDEESVELGKLLIAVGRTDVDLKRMLWRLAYEAHTAADTGDDDSLADIGELRLEKALAELHPEKSRDWASSLIEAIKLRAGLLVERAPEVYTFPHRTFQEYLAGAHLASLADFASQATLLSEDGAFWWQVILLAVGRLVYLGGDIYKPLALVGELCPADAGRDEISWRKAWLAGEVLVEVGSNRVQDSALGRDLLQRVRGRLVDLLRTSDLSPVERAEAGRILAKLGDPRAAVLDPLSIQWCEVPAGPFKMGDEGDDYTIPYDYRVSRYPVTNAQFQAFVDAGGYAEPAFWQPAIAHNCWQDGGVIRNVRGRDEGGGIKVEVWWADCPHDFGEPFNLTNHPVVGVSWCEALAFTRWLTDQLHEDGTLAQGWEVRLPNEPEWEKAARGVEGHDYPWWGKATPNHANYDKTGISTTSAVGCFPAGASPYGIEEMSGNVWEWTDSLYGDLPYPACGQEKSQRELLDSAEGRVLRGGSFDFTVNLLRCAARYRYDPYFIFDFIGFRVCAAPILSSR